MQTSPSHQKETGGLITPRVNSSVLPKNDSEDDELLPFFLNPSDFYFCLR